MKKKIWNDDRGQSTSSAAKARRMFFFFLIFKKKRNLLLRKKWRFIEQMAQLGLTKNGFSWGYLKLADVGLKRVS